MSKRYIVLVAAGLILIIGWGAVFAQQNRQSDTSKQAEQKFIQQMIMHHESAIQMSQQAAEQADNQQIKDLAASIIKDQQDEINKMRRWYKQWWGADVSKIETDPHAGHSAELQGATTFDQAYLAMMVPHHESAISMAKGVLPDVWHKEISALVSNIIETQTKEITQMRWLQQEVKNEGSFAGTQNQPMAQTITYTDTGFDHPSLTIPSGTSVTFLNQRISHPMWVASDVHPVHTLYPEFDQARPIRREPEPTDSTFTFTFTKKGTWPYHDHYDPGMKGKITVE